MDIWSKEKRSDVMSKIRSKDTKPEMMLRSILHRLGFRFRVHKKGLPGKPDIVLPKYGAAIFVHGCFWHLHADCREGRIPSSNKAYWKEKLEKNVARDQKHQKDLRELGWRVMIVWECEIEKSTEETVSKVLNFIHPKVNH